MCASSIPLLSKHNSTKIIVTCGACRLNQNNGTGSIFVLTYIQYDERNSIATTFLMMNSELTKSLMVVSFCFMII